ncbi:MAG: tetraacyldisaccharide 4'-kinase [Nitrospirae bacterium]|nr:tetraacyldisaccharide 4'-kinase [Nitrospirota bacterium]
MTLPELLYYIGYSFDKRRKLKGQKRLSYPVISIGNITVGGTGKTPATIAIAEEAKKRGLSPVILTKGYKGKAKGPCFVAPDSITPTLLFGDEPVLMAERLKDVPVVKCADRYEGGMFAIENLNSQILNFKSQIIFILDDGFQHWKLYRDMDVVLIDGLNLFGNRKMLPIGPLREPLKELKRADVFVVTKPPPPPPLDKGGMGGLSRELKHINPSASVYFSEYKTVKVRNASGEEFPVETLKDKKVFAFCGIANPESFIQTVLSVCRDTAGSKIYGDHHRYSQADIFYLAEQSKTLNCDFLIATEKDMVKIKELRGLSSKFQIDNILCLEIEFVADAAFFDEVFKNIF